MFCALLSNYLRNSYVKLIVTGCLVLKGASVFLLQKRGQRSSAGYCVLIFLFLLFIFHKKTGLKYALRQ